MKYSRQREMVRHFVMSDHLHPTADEVYSALKPDNPSLSLGTVYRNLSSLTKQGVLVKLHMPNGSDRYDGNIDEHYHVICSGCGAIFDVEYSLLDELDRKIEQKTGVKIESHQLLVNGKCQKCQ